MNPMMRISGLVQMRTYADDNEPPDIKDEVVDNEENHIKTITLPTMGKIIGVPIKNSVVVNKWDDMKQLKSWKTIGLARRMLLYKSIQLVVLTKRHNGEVDGRGDVRVPVPVDAGAAHAQVPVDAGGGAGQVQIGEGATVATGDEVQVPVDQIVDVVDNADYEEDIDGRGAVRVPVDDS